MPEADESLSQLSEEQLVEDYKQSIISYYLIAAQIATDGNFQTVIMLTIDHISKIPLEEIQSAVKPVKNLLSVLRRGEVQMSDSEIDSAYLLLKRFHPGLMKIPDNIPIFLDELFKASNVVSASLEILNDGEVWKYINNTPSDQLDRAWLGLKMAEKLFNARMKDEQ